MYLFRLHLRVRVNYFTVQQLGSHCLRHIVAVHSGCALMLSLSGFKVQDEIVDISIADSWGGHAIYVKEPNPHFQIVFFPCSKSDKVWVKHKNRRLSPGEDVGTFDCLSGREEYLGTFPHQAQN